jgi:hypothetical protein
LTGNLVGLFGFGQDWAEQTRVLVRRKIEQLEAKNELLKAEIEQLKAEKKLREAEDRKKEIVEIPDLNFSPQGHWSAFENISAGAEFVTVAKRALENRRLFERASFTMPVWEAELQVYGLKPDDATLSADGRERGKKRANKSITELMDMLVFFDLFEPTTTKHAYRLTDLGVTTYEILAAEAPTDSSDVRDTFQPGAYTTVGTASWGHSQVTPITLSIQYLG